MESIGINTSQNIQIKQKLASVGTRLVAIIIDLAILASYSFIVSILLGAANIASTALSVILYSLPWLLYFPVSETYMNGQTIGKRSMNIRVVKLNGSQPGVSAYILRWLLGMLEFTIGGGGIALLLIMFTQKGQRLGDMAAGTTVIRDAQNLNNLKRELQTMDSVGEDYEPVFSDARKLNDRDLHLIKEALRAFRKNGVREPMERLQQVLEQKMDIDDSQMHPIKFLETLLKDYTYYSLKQAEQV